MEIGTHCAFNISRNVLLCEHILEAPDDLDPVQFLALLLNGPGISQQSALWLRHFSEAKQLPQRLFAFDVAYLGEDQEILEAAGVGPGTEFPPVPEGTASLLFLPDRRLEETGSTRGNVVRICTEADLTADIEPTSHSSSFLDPREVYLKKRVKKQPEEAPSWPPPRPNSEFVFEPFVGSLVHFPAFAAPLPQSSEYFLPQAVSRKPISEIIEDSVQEQIAADALTGDLEQLVLEPIPPQLAFEEELAEFLAPEPEEFQLELEPEEINLPQTNLEEEQAPVAPLLNTAVEPEVPKPVASEQTVPVIAELETALPAGDSTEQEKLPSTIRIQRWLKGGKDKGSKKRRSKRINLPGLVAFYWSGGAPKPHEIVNISKTGFYLRTRDIWLPDTLVRMTLERPDPDAREPKLTVGVLARVVRIDEDGVGHEFVTTEALLRARSREILPEQGTSKKELEAFLNMR